LHSFDSKLTITFEFLKLYILNMFQTKGTINLFYFKNLSEQPAIKHFITGKKINTPGYEHTSLNMSFNTQAIPETADNFNLLSSETNIPLSQFVFQYQTHSSNVSVVGTNHVTNYKNHTLNCIHNNDALVTATKNIALFIKAADCVPIFLFDCKKNVIAAIHSGWKGTVQNITQQTINVMKGQFGTQPENIIAGIGPAIGVCCYEVGSEVYTNATLLLNTDAVFSHNIVTGKYHLNLKETNKNLLIKAGVPLKNIEITDICTKCSGSDFFSARNKDTGRFGGGIMLQ